MENLYALVLDVEEQTQLSEILSLMLKYGVTKEFEGEEGGLTTKVEEFKSIFEWVAIYQHENAKKYMETFRFSFEQLRILRLITDYDYILRTVSLFQQFKKNSEKWENFKGELYKMHYMMDEFNTMFYQLMNSTPTTDEDIFKVHAREISHYLSNYFEIPTLFNDDEEEEKNFLNKLSDILAYYYEE